MEDLLSSEYQSRWSIGIDERHDRYRLEKAHQQWLYEDRSSVTSSPAPQPEIRTVFQGDILEPTVVKRTAPLLDLEHKLQLLSRSSTRKGTGHDSLDDNNDCGYRSRLLQKRETTSRESIEQEEGEDFQRLRTRCGRGMLGLISAIVTFPHEMRQLAVLRLRDDERRAFVMRPTLLEEHWLRSELVFEEREQVARLLMMRTESAAIVHIHSRFHSIRNSINSFLRAQWLMCSVASVNFGIREKYFTNWKRHAHGKHRWRRIVLGLNHIRSVSEKKILHKYAIQWNHPIQTTRSLEEVNAIIGAEAELRDHMYFYEEECRARSCAEVLESVLFSKIVDDHFSVIGPLVEARRVAASLELEMLNSARHALTRLQTWYFWTIDHRNEAKVVFLREKAMFYSAQTRFRTWYLWTERRIITKDLLQTKCKEYCEMEEEVNRHVLDAKMTSRHHTILRRASKGLRRYDMTKVSKQLAFIARTAKVTFWRRYLERWLMYASRHSIESRALFLSRISQHIITTKYYCVWMEFLERRKDVLTLAIEGQVSFRNALFAEEQESFERLSITREAEVGILRLTRLAKRRGNHEQTVQALVESSNLYHFQLRFLSLKRFANRQIKHRRANEIVSGRAFAALASRYRFIWGTFACLHSEQRQRVIIEEDLLIQGSDLSDHIRISLSEIIAGIKLRTATALAKKNELLFMVSPYKRLEALVFRRRTARSKGPEVLQLEQKSAALLLSRYIQYWRKVVSRARMITIAVALCRKNELIVLRQYWKKFPPSKLRVAKISKVRQELQSAQSAAATLANEEERLVGPAKGSTLAGRLTLRRHPNHVFM